MPVVCLLNACCMGDFDPVNISALRLRSRTVLINYNVLQEIYMCHHIISDTQELTATEIESNSPSQFIYPNDWDIKIIMVQWNKEAG